MRRTRLEWPTWIGVVAKNLEVQRRFYREILGFQETEAGDGWVQFDVSGHMFEVIQLTDDEEYNAARYQVGFTVDDIEAARAELIAACVEPLTEVEGGPESRNRWCYFRDPEGRVFEVTQWTHPRYGTVPTDAR